ncbi:MAG: ribonuclease HI family protein [bacterium]
MNKKFTIYTDGGARGNPGPAGIGVVIRNEQGEVLDEISKYIGETTNNQAEYQAVVEAMKKSEKLAGNDSKKTELDFNLDSELVVKQLNGDYKVRSKELQPLFVKIYNSTLSFKKVKFKHVRREKNKEADKLANQAMDRGDN